MKVEDVILGLVAMTKEENPTIVTHHLLANTNMTVYMTERGTLVCIYILNKDFYIDIGLNSIYKCFCCDPDMKGFLRIKIPNYDDIFTSNGVWWIMGNDAGLLDLNAPWVVEDKIHSGMYSFGSDANLREVFDSTYRFVKLSDMKEIETIAARYRGNTNDRN